MHMLICYLQLQFSSFFILGKGTLKENKTVAEKNTYILDQTNIFQDIFLNLLSEIPSLKIVGFKCCGC